MPLFLIGCAVSKTQKELDARTPTGATPVQVDTDDDLNFCYSMTGIAKNTVIKRNQGLLLENQQQQRKERFGEQSDIYILIDDFTRKVYSKKMTNSVESAINFHKSCIALQQPQMQYNPSA